MVTFYIFITFGNLNVKKFTLLNPYIIKSFQNIFLLILKDLLLNLKVFHQHIT